MSIRSLVSGGAGFIGSHLVEALLARGDTVRVLDDFSSGSRVYLPSHDRLGVLEGSVTSQRDCLAACEGVGEVYHLAAMSRAGPSDDKMDECIQTNIVGTENLLTASNIHRVRSFVYAGSSTVYGNRVPRNGGYPEDESPDCRTPYAWSKYAGEGLCRMYAMRGWLDTKVVRYFSVYGPRQPKTGTYALVLGIFAAQKAAGLPLTLHGTGDQSRDFVHVRDVVEGTILAAAKSGFEVYNLGTGRSLPVRKVAELIDPGGRRVFAQARAGDAWETRADIWRARRYLDWAPTIQLEEGIQGVETW